MLLSLLLAPLAHAQEENKEVLEEVTDPLAHAQEEDKEVLEEVTDHLAGEKLLAAQVNAIAVLNMIRALEQEMEVIMLLI